MPEHHDQVPTREKVLVIGAGPAGLAAAAALKALGVPFDLVDRAKDVGGIWNPDREDTPTWPAMEMISSRAFTQYQDMLQPVSFPEFLTPTHMAKYLRAYAARYDLTEEFRGGVEVRTARPYGEHQWQVEMSTGHIAIYRAVVSAHGIAGRPHRPSWAARIPDSVQVLDARDWRGPDGYEGKRVLVVGSGQSAADIAVDAARRALEVRWSIRTGHWVVPRRFGGVPGDVAATREPVLLGGLNRHIARTVVKATAGDPAAVGMPVPAAGVLEDTVIVSDTVLDRVREGRITPVGDVVAVHPDGTVSCAPATGSRPIAARAVDAEGAAELTAPASALTYAPDVIVLATGYETGADHLPADVVPRAADGTPDLFLGAFPRDREDLVVLGQVRAPGGVLPILVQQADLAAYLLRASLRGDSAALEEFRRLRAAGDAAVPTASTSHGGLRGRVSDAVGTSRTPARTPAGRDRQGAEDLVPAVDRATLLARLRSAREPFEHEHERELARERAAERVRLRALGRHSEGFAPSSRRDRSA